MQDTSALWKEMVRDAKREYCVDINGVRYGAEEEVEQTVTNGLYEDFSIGNAASATLKLSVIADDIPAGAEIRRYVRLNDGERQSEWLPKGVFFVSRRSEEDGRWEVEAFDVMRKAEVEWVPADDTVFPMSMKDAVDVYIGIMGCELDPRTSINPAYTLDYPAGYTIRQELQSIAAAHGGNWIVTDEGKLLLVPILSAPPGTHYLVTEHGDAITFGGVRILV